MTVIELDGLTKQYGQLRAADDLTFSVEEGEIFGYLGPNGAGKTTTIRMLMGFLAPTDGTARVLGTDVTDRRSLVEAKRRIGYLSDEPGFDEDATGRELLELHATVKGDDRSEQLLEQFDPPIDRRIREYSRGNVQKLGIVATFMHDPDLVILDEPTSGLDPLMKQRFAEFLRNERRRGTTVFFSSHVLGEVRRLCDRVAIIREGRLVTVEPVETLLRRSGKVVRISTSRPVSTDVLDIEGVHDLETSLDRREDTSSGDDGDAPGDEGVAFTDCTFTFVGDVGELIDRLQPEPITDLSIEEAPLEDVFLRFYGDADV